MKEIGTGYINTDKSLECEVIYESDSGKTYVQYQGMMYRVEHNAELDVWDAVELVTDQFRIN